jgi:hypothetical protein
MQKINNLKEEDQTNLTLPFLATFKEIPAVNKAIYPSENLV